MTVLLFARAKDLAGTDRIEMDAATVGELRTLLALRYPKLASLLATSAIAVNGEFAQDAATLSKGAEVALLPPVSGGQDEGMVRLTRNIIDYHALTEEVRRGDCGAVVLFLGTVRDLTDERVTVALDYEAYPDMAQKKMAEIEAETRTRWPVGGMILEHRLGHLDVGDISVAVAVSCPHRAQAFDACRYAIDRLKELVPIWKKENWADGSTEWVHPGT